MANNTLHSQDALAYENHDEYRAIQQSSQSGSSQDDAIVVSSDDESQYDDDGDDYFPTLEEIRQPGCAVSTAYLSNSMMDWSQNRSGPAVAPPPLSSSDEDSPNSACSTSSRAGSPQPYLSHAVRRSLHPRGAAARDEDRPICTSTECFQPSLDRRISAGVEYPTVVRQDQAQPISANIHSPRPTTPDRRISAGVESPTVVRQDQAQPISANIHSPRPTTPDQPICASSALSIIEFQPILDQAVSNGVENEIFQHIPVIPGYTFPSQAPGLVTTTTDNIIGLQKWFLGASSNLESRQPTQDRTTAASIKSPRPSLGRDNPADIEYPLPTSLDRVASALIEIKERLRKLD
ncbi:hypothetical protein VM1G_09079 [Cytospora mali]|uniref:Uncharacterized protein n=1 Tax=Cytospora mali TaxID=578113 RepID=A0A194W9R8_CYTMA|nr:hypothetical protein VM1G_09079 [Valsa mali]